MAPNRRPVLGYIQEAIVTQRLKQTIFWSFVVVCIAGAAFILAWKLWTGRPAGTPKPLPKLKSPRIVIEKRRRRLTVFDGQTPVKNYRIGLGWGKGNKLKEGDGCTPEGEFYICHHNPQSRYRLSLGLSYPNEEDAARGLREGLISRQEHDSIVNAIEHKKTPPWNTKLGGEIMIHGNGADRDWTGGCVAMEDADIEELYKALPDGTAVEILP